MTASRWRVRGRQRVRPCPITATLARAHCDHYAGHRYDHFETGSTAARWWMSASWAPGAAGGVLAHRLARAGLDVVVIEAGPFWDPETTSPATSCPCSGCGWQETRLVAGDDP